MIKCLIYITFAMLWFVFSGLFFAKNVTSESWFYSFLFYLVGMYWVIPFLLSWNMSAPYSIGTLTPDKKNKKGRLFLFLFGLFIAFSAST